MAGSNGNNPEDWAIRIKAPKGLLGPMENDQRPDGSGSMVTP